MTLAVAMLCSDLVLDEVLLLVEVLLLLDVLPRGLLFEAPWVRLVATGAGPCRGRGGGRRRGRSQTRVEREAALDACAGAACAGAACLASAGGA